MNRLILGVLGLVFFIIGASTIAAATLAGISPKVVKSVSAVPELSTALVRTSAWGVAVASLIVLILCLLWIFTRGRGRVSHAVRVENADGRVEIDRRYLEDALGASLDGQRDVTHVSVSAYRFRRARVARALVQVRRGCDVAAVAGATRAAVASLDEELGVAVPLVVRIVSAPIARSRRAA